MKKRISALILCLMFAVLCCATAFASDIPRAETPNYRVAFYAFDCYHMQDENGVRSGYGYEMMQGLARYMQCTFSYVGYDKSAAECVEMLRNGKLDLYTAAKLTPERQQEFAISNHPAITATTCMNVKVGNTKVKAGDYSTYNGLRVGLLQRHTYNDAFLEFVKQKGFACTITYYETPTELTNALINDEVDAVVNSYLGIPEDERTVESFGETPYYIMARKSDQALIDAIDNAMDSMNVELPNWRTDLYSKYYGEQEQNTEYTAAELALLQQLQQDGAIVRAVMCPGNAPYSDYVNGKAQGIVADIFRAAAEQLGLDYEIVEATDRTGYQHLLNSGDIDILMDMYGHYGDEGTVKYKLTNNYLETNVSLLRASGEYGHVNTIAIADDSSAVQTILDENFPNAKIIKAKSAADCAALVLNHNADAAFLMTYTAQTLARNDVQNRLRADIIPGATLNLRMGVNADDPYEFYGLWEKTLTLVAQQQGAEIVQSYMEQTINPTLPELLFDHPAVFVGMVAAVLLILCLLLVAVISMRSNTRQRRTAEQLAVALEQARDANEAKQNFFSKMSHDIRTPMNVVLGMTQIAQKYKRDPVRLENALNNITTEGNYLLVLINSILDVNQLEHGHMELQNAPFDPAAALRDSAAILQPLAEKKEQTLTVTLPQESRISVGDANRFDQIIINIVSNAVKYTPAGGKIDVALAYLPDNRCRFTCADNGIGMTKEFIAHITEEYSRAEDSRVSKVQGTGLGMSVVKGFTDLMHGTLTIESEPGKGSTFIVEIPFEAATEQQIEQLRKEQQETEQQPEMYTGKRVLLAEDNALNAEIAVELLKTIGLTVDWVENGKLAVEQLTNSEPGTYYAVFMDMQMPVMDGVEATRQIRAADHPDHSIPIFAMTANTFAADRKKCLDAGMSGYIAKPINLSEITATLHGEMKDEKEV